VLIRYSTNYRSDYFRIDAKLFAQAVGVEGAVRPWFVAFSDPLHLDVCQKPLVALASQILYKFNEPAIAEGIIAVIIDPVDAGALLLGGLVDDPKPFDLSRRQEVLDSSAAIVFIMNAFGIGAACVDIAKNGDPWIALFISVLLLPHSFKVPPSVSLTLLVHQRPVRALVGRAALQVFLVAFWIQSLPFPLVGGAIAA
jgi:hypothetical protein